MRTLAFLGILALSAGAAFAQEAPPPTIDVVFCIDRSGSMSAVIETAKQKVWSIVNEIAKSKPSPVLRIGLIGYGSADREFKFFQLTDDLDKAYENLLTFRTDMGGDEWVGAAVKKASEEMSWSAGPTALKIVFVVGNETAAQGREDVLYTKTVPEAIKRDIIVNAIYAGSPSPEEARTWQEVAQLADGSYTTIDPSGGAVTIATPMDKELAELNVKLNGTYVAFGAKGERGRLSQAARDKESEEHGGASTMADRAAAKAQSVYNCREWDLVDAFQDAAFKLEEVTTEDLPKELQTMTLDERRNYIDTKRREREETQKKILALAAERQKYIDQEMKAKNLTQDQAFDEAVRKAIRAQACKRGFTFE